MRIHMDDEERARLAARLGYGEDATDTQMATAFFEWIHDQPPARSGRRLTPEDLENLRTVSDFTELESAQEGGYAQNMTGWLGAG